MHSILRTVSRFKTCLPVTLWLASCVSSGAVVNSKLPQLALPCQFSQPAAQRRCCWTLRIAPPGLASQLKDGTSVLTVLGWRFFLTVPGSEFKVYGSEMGSGAWNWLLKEGVAASAATPGCMSTGSEQPEDSPCYPFYFRHILADNGEQLFLLSLSLSRSLSGSLCKYTCTCTCTST